MCGSPGIGKSLLISNILEEVKKDYGVGTQKRSYL